MSLIIIITSCKLLNLLNTRWPATAVTNDGQIQSTIWFKSRLNHMYWFYLTIDLKARDFIWIWFEFIMIWFAMRIYTVLLRESRLVDTILLLLLNCGKISSRCPLNLRAFWLLLSSYLYCWWHLAWPVTVHVTCYWQYGTRPHHSTTEFVNSSRGWGYRYAGAVVNAPGKGNGLHLLTV